MTFKVNPAALVAEVFNLRTGPASAQLPQAEVTNLRHNIEAEEA
jgi:hypothetical protein